jgi:hypothetical protein
MIWPESYDDQFEMFDAFLDGMNSIQFVPNSQDCSKRSLIFLNDQNATKIDREANPDRPEFEQVRNITSLISN